MPAYLCHGFRWQRRSVRVYVVVQNLDDASPEWIIPAKSSQCLLESFYNLFDFLPYCVPPSRSGQGSNLALPSLDSDDDSYVYSTAAYNGVASRSRSQSVTQGQNRQRSRSQSRSISRQPSNGPAPPPALPRSAGSGASVQGGNRGAEDDVRAQDWSVVKLLEEYDPMNLDEVSRPYAYVADYVVRVDLSVGIVEEIQRYEERSRADRDPPMTGPGSDETGRKKGGKKTGWFEKLRDQLQRGEEIRWYVVVNDDEVRDWPDDPEKKPEPLLRPTPTRQQQQHHAQYTYQQQIFEGNDGRRTRGGPGPGQRMYEVPRGTDTRPVVPDKDLPTLRPKMSTDGGRPSKGGLRRLFGGGRNKADDYSP